MQQPTGIIVEIHEDASGDSAVLAVDQQAVCARCAAGKGCGAGIIGGSRGSGRLEAKLRPGLQLEIGDRVSVSLAPRNLLKAAAIVYGIPLLGAAIAAALGLALQASDPQAVVLALGGLAAGIGVGKLQLRGCINDLVPVVTGLVR